MHDVDRLVVHDVDRLVVHDVDRLVEGVGDGFESSSSCVPAAKALTEISEPDHAVRWARAGLEADPRNHRRADALADVYMARGEPELLTEIVWPRVAQTNHVNDHRGVRHCAEAAGSWRARWLRALDRARELAAERDGARQAELHMHEGEVDQAWAWSQRFGCSRSVLPRIAGARGVEHPAGSADVYLAQVDRELESAFATKRLDEIVRLLTRADALSATLVVRTRFDEAIARIRAGHARERTLTAKLDGRGW